MIDADKPTTRDRVFTREWSIDLAEAGLVRSPKKRPAKRQRQKIARFVGRDGDVETFALRQTIPYTGYEAECPPSQLQYGAVFDFFAEPCETRFQANTLLCARDYSAVVARTFSFTPPRREFIWRCVAAYILDSTDLRSRVKAWNIKSGFGDISSGIAYHRPYKDCLKFAAKLVDDMRGSGSQIFG